MKLGPLSKFEKRNTIKLWKLDDDAILRNSESFLIFLINWSGCNAYFFNSNDNSNDLAKSGNRI